MPKPSADHSQSLQPNQITCNLAATSINAPRPLSKTLCSSLELSGKPTDKEQKPNKHRLTILGGKSQRLCVGDRQQSEGDKVDDDDVWRSKSTRLTRQRRRAVSVVMEFTGAGIQQAWSVLVHALRCVWLERNE